jgi:hypothetical protein
MKDDSSHFEGSQGMVLPSSLDSIFCCPIIFLSHFYTTTSELLFSIQVGYPPGPMTQILDSVSQRIHHRGKKSCIYIRNNYFQMVVDQINKI